MHTPNVRTASPDALAAYRNKLARLVEITSRPPVSAQESVAERQAAHKAYAFALSMLDSAAESLTARDPRASAFDGPVAVLDEHADVAAANPESLATEGFELAGHFITDVQVNALQSLEDSEAAWRLDGIAIFGRVRERDASLHGASLRINGEG